MISKQTEKLLYELVAYMEVIKEKVDKLVDEEKGE